MRTGGILLTGFEPFGRWRVNSSWEGARLVAARRPGRIALLRLPVDHEAAARILRAALAARDPAACLMTGLAAGSRFRLERIARTGPYVDGPEEDEPAERAPDARPGDWRWGAARARVRAGSGPCALSRDPGRYVCESAYRALLDWRAERGRPKRAAFLHVPPLGRTWSADRVAGAIEAALDAL